MNGSEIIHYKFVEAETYTVNDVQEQLLNKGPTYFRFNVYSDFMNYKSGVYKHITGELEGGHAVLLLGWGAEKGVRYWLLQNSWGVEWGENGYFKMIRGCNECGC